ncbi:MAG: hypothetical protein JNK25_03515 [Phycisphaerae bacterium]|nr:hypothetical protein [Phycisphaerae bacterium]
MDTHAYAKQIVSNSRPLHPSDLTCPLVSVSYRRGASPPERDAEFVRRLITAVKNDERLPTVPLQPRRGEAFQCVHNVEYLVNHYGGEAVVGYAALTTKGMRGIDFSAHMVWESPEGLITEATTGYEDHPFFPFPEAQPHIGEVIRLWPDWKQFNYWAVHGFAHEMFPGERFLIELGPVPFAENQNCKRFKVRKKVRR